MDHIELFNKMIEYYEGDPKRIQHFTKVFEYCRLIGTMENIPEKEQFALETTALVHDIGKVMDFNDFESTEIINGNSAAY